MRTKLPGAAAPRTALLGAALLMAGGGAHTLLAQGVPGEAGAGVLVQSFRFSEEAVTGYRGLTLVTLPFSATARVGPATRVNVRGGWARGSLDREGADGSVISGPLDTEISLSHRLGQDAVVISGIALLPTGKSSHTPAEAEVAGAISADILPFRISSWGTGGGFGGSVAVARPMGGWGVGASVGYVVAGNFEPRSGEPFVFQPGNMLRVNAVVDRTVASTGKLALRFSLQDFSDDAVDGVNLFRSGRRYDLTTSYAFPAGRRSSAIVYGGLLHRDKGSYLQPTDDREAPSQDLVVVGAGMRGPWAGGIVTPAADLRLHRRSDGIGQGFSAGVGTQAEWALQGGGAFIPQLRVRFGNVEVREGSSSGFAGVEAGATVRLGRLRS